MEKEREKKRKKKTVKQRDNCIELQQISSLFHHFIPLLLVFIYSNVPVLSLCSSERHTPHENIKGIVHRKINILSLFTLCVLKLFQNLILLLFFSVQTQKAKLDAALLHTMTTFIVTTFVKLQKAPIMTLLLYSKKVIKLFCVMNRLNYMPFVMPSPAAFRSNMADW